MQTSPCGHRVVCRRCFVKTIQMAVSQRLLPLRCVICRAKILRLRHAPRLTTSKSWQVSSSGAGSGSARWGVPGSASCYSVGARSVPASASLYSVTSGESSLSGLSSVSSASSEGCAAKVCAGSRCGGACLGAVPRQPSSSALRRSQHHSMKLRLQEYQIKSYTGEGGGAPCTRLPPIREFQREFREGRRESPAPAAPQAQPAHLNPHTANSASTRIRCAQKIVTQLEITPPKRAQNFFRSPLKSFNKDSNPKASTKSKEKDDNNDVIFVKKKDNKTKQKKEDKKKRDDEKKQEDKVMKDEHNDNKKNENAERKKEEKLKLKAEREAKKEAKKEAKEEERLAKLVAKEEKKKAKKVLAEKKENEKDKKS